MLLNDTMDHRLILVYEDNGNIQSWKTESSNGSAQGNPMSMNLEIAYLRRSHQILLAKRGAQPLRANALSFITFSTTLSDFVLSSELEREHLEPESLIFMLSWFSQ